MRLIDFTRPTNPIRYVETGSYVVEPYKTIQKVLRHRSDIGITKLEKVDDRVTYNIPIYRLNWPPNGYVCQRDLSLDLTHPSKLDLPLRATYGKGWTETQSKASALMEAVERFSSQAFSHVTIFKNPSSKSVSLDDFNTPNMLPPKCMNCKERGVSCFRDLTRFNGWVQGFSLTRREPVMVPATAVFYPYLEDGKSYMYNDTGGLASGNTIIECVRDGVAEIIERDALYHAYCMENLLEMPRIVGIDGSWMVEGFYRRAIPHNKVLSFKIHNDNLGVGATTISSFVVEKRVNGLRLFGGSGTHIKPEVSMLRALTEMVQQKIRMGVNTIVPYDRFVDWVSVPRRTLPPLEDKVYVEDELKVYIDQLKKSGHEIYYVDLTHPRINIPVVRVIIPGLINYSMPFKASLVNRVIEEYT